VSESPETTPLSAEEERDLRERHWAMPSRGGSQDIARLLATLDAARATVPAGPEPFDAINADGSWAARPVPAAEPPQSDATRGPDADERFAVPGGWGDLLPDSGAVPAAEPPEDAPEWDSDVRMLAWFALGASKGKPRDAARRVLGWCSPGTNGDVDPLREAARVAIDRLETIADMAEAGGDIPTEAQIAINRLTAALAAAALSTGAPDTEEQP
jgi:hypothetical protein